MGKYALILVGALIFSVLTYSYALKNALFQSNTRTVQSFSQNQAYNIAQSAAMVTINDIRNIGSSDFNPGFDETYTYPLDGGYASWDDMHGDYRVQVANQADTLLVVQTIGRFEKSMHRALVGLSMGTTFWNPTFDQALHAENLIHPSGSVDISCVNDSPKCQVTINSINAGAIDVGGSSTIDADLFIGPGGDPATVVNGEENISGDINVMPARIDYPMPIFPDYSDLNFLSGSSVYNSTMTLQPNDYEQKHISEILMTSGNNTLTIDTGNQDREMRVGRLELGGQNQINVVGEGKLTIYVDYDVDMKGGSSINKEGDVNNLMLYYKGNQDVELYDETLDFGGNTFFNGTFFADLATVRLQGTAGIQGNVITGGNIELSGDAEAISRVIYAPRGTVRTNGNTGIRGSVISNEFTGDGNVTLIYDQELGAELPELEVIGGDFPIVYWN